MAAHQADNRDINTDSRIGFGLPITYRLTLYWKAWVLVVTVFLLFTSLAVIAAYGQVDITVSPPNPVAGQPITLTAQLGASSWTYRMYVHSDAHPLSDGTCAAGFAASEPLVANLTTQSEGNGEFTATLSAGLPAGTYDAVVPFLVWVSAQGGYASSICKMFTVSPTPVPEFNGNVAVVSFLALATTLYILRQRH